jgi:DNA-binding response OmpR family regulator
VKKEGKFMQKILIIEDDQKLSQELQIFLNRNGYLVERLETFEHPLEDILAANADLLLLDIGLPNTDGEFLLKEIRKVSDVPVIMITSRNNEIDELLSMHYGADHYVTKPFNQQILLAKMAAVLKRTNAVMSQEKIHCGSFVLDVSKSQIETGQRRIELTANELKIVKCLVRQKGTIVSREELMEELWESDAFIDDNTLTVNMTRIRKKFEELGLCNVIVTKRGQGYLLLPESR